MLPLRTCTYHFLLRAEVEAPVQERRLELVHQQLHSGVFFVVELGVRCSHRGHATLQQQTVFPPLLVNVELRAFRAHARL